MIPQKNEYWVVDLQMAPGRRMIRTVVNIYRVSREGDIAFTMCGDEDIYWRSQFVWFDSIRKVDMGMKTNDVESKGKGWEEVKPRPIRVEYGFRCKDCGAQIDGFVVSPRFCPYCGKEHG